MKREQWLSLSLLVLAGVVNFLDRSSLSIAASPIRSEMHLSASTLGMLFSAFTLAYGVAQLPLGPILDRFGSWRIMTFGLALWSVAQLLSGAMRNVAGLMTMRILLGLGEAPFFPASLKLIGQRFETQQRGRAVAAVNISTAAGQALAPGLLTLLMLRCGWRLMFAVLGGMGLVLAVIWAWVGKASPNTSEAVRKEPLGLGIRAALLKRRMMWAMMIGFGGVNYTAWFYISWLPLYLQKERHLSIATSGFVAVLPYLAAGFGMYASGLIADLRFRRNRSLRRVHLSQIIAGMVLSAFCTLIAVRIDSFPSSLGLICSALFCIHFAGTSAWGYAQAVSEPNVVATVGALQNFGSFVIASIAPYATGLLFDKTGHFGAAFDLCAVVALLCAATYAFMTEASGVPLGEMQSAQVPSQSV